MPLMMPISLSWERSIGLLLADTALSCSRAACITARDIFRSCAGAASQGTPALYQPERALKCALPCHRAACICQRDTSRAGAGAAFQRTSAGYK